jgi:hypothetical protein
MKRNLTRGILAGVTGATLVAMAALWGGGAAEAYAPAQQNLYTPTNPGSCNKSPCVLYPKSTELPNGRLVAGFEDDEQAVVGQTMPIYKSDDHGDSWQKLTDLKAPAYLSSDPAYAKYTSNWTNPYFYVLPQDVGSLKAGTLLLADVVSGADAAPNPNGNGNRQNLAIALYASTDNGASWTVNSIIATGANQAQDPVWEPYLMVYQGQLVAYYSDENDYLSYNTTTGVPTIDPANTTATDSGGQVLVHRTWNGSGAWNDPVIDVAGSTVDRGNGKTEIGGDRPGMTNVVPTTDGKWLATFEYFGGGANHYKIASNPLRFFADGSAAGTDVGQLPVSTGSSRLAGGGSPVLLREPNGAIVYNAAGSGDVWVNASGSSTGTWKQYKTPVTAGYSRDLQYVSATGRVEILQASWSGNSVGPITHGQVDLGNSTGTYYTLVNRATGEVLTPQSGKTQDAAFTGNAPDIVTAAKNTQNVGQWWHLMKKGSTTTLLNKSGGRALGAWQGASSAGTSLAQWVDDNGADKNWTLVDLGNGYVQLRSTANPSEYATASTSSGGAVTLQNASSNGTQDWQLVPDFTTTANSSFQIVNVASGKVLGVNAASTADGAAAVQWTANGSPDQAWQFTTLTNGNLSIVDRNSGKSLGVHQASKTSGAQAVQWTTNTSPDQQWTLVQIGTSWQIKNVNSGLVLSVQGSTSDGTNIVQAAAGTGSDQLWRLVQVSNQ